MPVQGKRGEARGGTTQEDQAEECNKGRDCSVCCLRSNSNSNRALRQPTPRGKAGTGHGRPGEAQGREDREDRARYRTHDVGADLQRVLLEIELEVLEILLQPGDIALEGGVVHARLLGGALTLTALAVALGAVDRIIHLQDAGVQ